MKKLMLSLFDEPAGVFCTPFFSHNEATALRDLDHAVKDPASQIHRSPGDFTMYELGYFDDTTAELVLTSPIRRIIRADELDI